MSRKNISLTNPVEERAAKIIARRGFAGLSDMIAVLVREEYERRGLDKPQQLREDPVPYNVSPSAKPSSLAQVEDEIVDAILEKEKPPKPEKPK